MAREITGKDMRMHIVHGAVSRDLLIRIQMEYLEMPGLRLTASQARRLWNLEEPVCAEILATLVRDNFLGRTPDGSYVRLGTGRHRLPVAV